MTTGLKTLRSEKKMTTGLKTLTSINRKEEEDNYRAEDTKK